MATEIERKFLVAAETWRSRVIRSHHLSDYLIAAFSAGKVRLRRCNGDHSLTLKGRRVGVSRSEYVLPVTTEDAEAMIAEFAVGPPIEKIRHDVTVGDLVWQVDEYAGPLAGLVTADVELPNLAHPLAIPAWAGQEITGDPRYASGHLAQMVFDGAHWTG